MRSRELRIAPGTVLRRSTAACVVLALPAVLACSREAPPPAWTLSPVLEAQESGTAALLIGTSIVDTAVVWVSGARGTWARTVDGGATWRTGVVPGADSLQFRDVHAVDAQNAFLLSIGNGADSRIYRTADGGATWTLQFRNEEPRAFFDCFAFWDAQSGIAFSDSFDGRFLLLQTSDGGVTWAPIPPEVLPPAHEGEGAFAASGTCVVAAGDGSAWIGTGASEGGARVLRTTDRGRTWSIAETPLVRGEAAGIASLAFRDALHGAALGGDIAQPDALTDNVAITRDGGVTWELAGRPPFTGAVYGSSWVPGAPSPTLVAAGPRGLGYSTDEGRTWAALDTLNHWGVAFASPDRGWAVGPNGRITRIRLFTRE
jgi:photosystem II stability/assembly factor-like uncharacterized protein